MICRYIIARDVDAFHAQGWQVYKMKGHHGARGRWLAVIEL